MELTKRKIDDQTERQIVTGMIVSDRYLQEVRPLYQPHLMELDPCRTLAGWCLDYWGQYGRAPGIHIQDIFHSHARNGLGDAEADIIASILAAANEEYERAEKFNVDYLLDQTERHFKGKSLLRLTEDLKTALVSPAGGPLEAERVLGEYARVERPRRRGLCPMTDREAVKAAFAEQASPLFNYGGPLGEMLNPMLTRAGFLALLAPPKRGKSWMLMELALRAAGAGCNVAFFECGDMTEPQWLRRFHVRLAFRPYRHYRSEYQGTVQIPFLVPGQDGMVRYEEHRVEPLNAREALRSGRMFLKKKMKGRRLRLVCHSSGTLTLSAVRTQLDLWEQLEGFIPDVLIFDYADILAPEKAGPKDFRHQQNDVWKGLRALSQERHCLVLTASQSNSDGIKREQLSARNFSEDMRKLAHVTGMYGLNQTAREKAAGLLRLNEIVVREGDFNNTRSVSLLQALHVGRPVLGNYWTREKEEDGEE